MFHLDPKQRLYFVLAAIFLTSLEERDNPFPDVDYRVFAARQGSAAAV